MKKFKFIPAHDGEDHVNIYTKGKTELGRALSNLADTPFVMGGKTFQSVESFWYYYLTGCVEEKLCSMKGYQAKVFGRTLCHLRIDDEQFGPQGEHQEVIKEAMRCKLRQNKWILELLTESTLPLSHYYAFPNKQHTFAYNIAKFQWQVDEFERLRNLMRVHKGLPEV